MSIRVVLLAIVGIVVAVLAVGCGGDDGDSGEAASAADGKAQTLTLATRPIADMIPAHLCVERGICEKHGVNLEIENFSGTSADISAALEAGEVDLAYVGVTNVLQARQGGLDQVIVASASTESPKNPSGDANGLAFKDPSIRTGKDLEGKSVGVLGLESASQAIVMTWVEKTGGDPSKVEYVALPEEQKPAAVDGGRVDAGHINEPDLSVAREELGLKTINVALGILPEGLTIGAIAAKGAAVAENPDLFAGLAEALQESSELANKDQKLAKETLESFSSLDPKVIAKSNLPLFDARVSPGNTAFWKTAINEHFDAGITIDPKEAIAKRALTVD